MVVKPEFFSCFLLDGLEEECGKRTPLDSVDPVGEFRAWVVWRGTLTSPSVHSSGGCNPALTQCWRAVTTVALFIRSASIVARPQAVLPMIRVPSSLHAKCCDHRWRRGLNNGTRRPVSTSRACVWAPLNSLQLRHDSQRFSLSEVPPYTSGIMCSTVNGIPDTASRVNQ
jgi:hypothetical protein